MKIFLQNKKTMGFVANLSKPTEHTLQRKIAHRFATGIEALSFCTIRQLTDMRVCYDFTNALSNFTCPVTDLTGMLISEPPSAGGLPKA